MDLPLLVLDKIAEYADHDSRRYLGYPPRKLVRNSLHEMLDEHIRRKLAHMCHVFHSPMWKSWEQFIPSPITNQVVFIRSDYEKNGAYISRVLNIQDCAIVYDHFGYPYLEYKNESYKLNMYRPITKAASKYILSVFPEITQKDMHP